MNHLDQLLDLLKTEANEELLAKCEELINKAKTSSSFTGGYAPEGVAFTLKGSFFEHLSTLWQIYYLDSLALLVDDLNAENKKTSVETEVTNIKVLQYGDLSELHAIITPKPVLSNTFFGWHGELINQSNFASSQPLAQTYSIATLKNCLYPDYHSPLQANDNVITDTEEQSVFVDLPPNNLASNEDCDADSVGRMPLEDYYLADYGTIDDLLEDEDMDTLTEDEKQFIKFDDLPSDKKASFLKRIEDNYRRKANGRPINEAMEDEFNEIFYSDAPEARQLQRFAEIQSSND